MNDEYNAIIHSDRPELERVAAAFEWVTGQTVREGEREIELARATQDRERQVKEQIKVATIRHARQIFSESFLLVTGRRPWDER